MILHGFPYFFHPFRTQIHSHPPGAGDHSRRLRRRGRGPGAAVDSAAGRAGPAAADAGDAAGDATNAGNEGCHAEPWRIMMSYGKIHRFGWEN